MASSSEWQDRELNVPMAPSTSLVSSVYLILIFDLVDICSKLYIQGEQRLSVLIDCQDLIMGKHGSCTYKSFLNKARTPVRDRKGI